MLANELPKHQICSWIDQRASVECTYDSEIEQVIDRSWPKQPLDPWRLGVRFTPKAAAGLLNC
jgi:hypothetical protein